MPVLCLAGLHILGYILCYFSACVNPIIYVIMSRQYRQAYKTVLFCRRPRLFSDSSVQCESTIRRHKAQTDNGDTMTVYS